MGQRSHLQQDCNQIILSLGPGTQKKSFGRLKHPRLQRRKNRFVKTLKAHVRMNIDQFNNVVYYISLRILKRKDTLTHRKMAFLASRLPSCLYASIPLARASLIFGRQTCCCRSCASRNGSALQRSGNLNKKSLPRQITNPRMASK